MTNVAAADPRPGKSAAPSKHAAPGKNAPSAKGAPDAAGTSTAEAARLLALGNDHFAASRWDEAVAAYRQSLALAPSPKTRVNLAVAVWKKGDASTAATELDGVLADAAAANEVKTAARDVLDQIEAEVARIDIRAEGTGRVSVDGKALGSAPLRHRLYVSPGKHTIAVGDTKDTFSVLAGEVRILDIAPRPASAALATTPNAPRPLPPAWRWVVPSAVGVLGLTVGTIYGRRVQSAEDEIARLNETSSEHDYALARALEDRGRSDATIANVAFAIGAATAVTAVYIFITDRREPRVGIGFNGASAWANVRF